MSPLNLGLLSVLVGIIGGLGAVLFRGLIAFLHNLLLLGQISFSYDANVPTPASPWGPWVILVPVAAALGVTFLTERYAPEAKGHGVPEVMDAIYYHRGIIRPIVALIKSLASALSIGSGGSVGREGPIIQIGSSFGSTLGQIIPMPVWQRITLVAAGAGAGMAGTFNTPVGAVLFAMEILLHEISARTVVPVAIATATGTYVGRLFFGDHPSFVIPSFQVPYFHVTEPYVLVSYVGLGVVAGLVSTLYIRSIYAFEDVFEDRFRNPYLRHMLGMLLVGATMYLMMVAFGDYYVAGIGYSVVQDVLTGTLASLALLLLLAFLKLVTVSLTLGSGASGGIFSPGLFIGATMGAAYGIIVNALFPQLAVSPPAFAVAGMAGVIGGSTGAALAAIVMIFEMTLDYSVIVPMTIVVALSWGIRRALSHASIYDLKLARRGHFMPDSHRADFEYMRRVADVMEEPVVVAPSTPLIDFARMVSERTGTTHYLIADEAGIRGVVAESAALEALDESHAARPIGEIADTNLLVLTEEATLLDALVELRGQNAHVALVAEEREISDPSKVLGIVTRLTIARAAEDAIELYADER